MRKKKKVNRKKDKAPTPSIVDFASSTAELVANMVKLAGENDCVEDAYSAFRHQLQENLNEHQRDLLAKLMYECYEEFNSIRGSEKSSSEDHTQIDPDISEQPEPVPKEVAEKVQKEFPYDSSDKIVSNDLDNDPNTTNNPNNENFVNYVGEPEKSLFGYGVAEEEAPGKYQIDKLLERGAYTKQDIVTVTQYHPDTVRKRITYIEKHIPEIVIVKDSNQNTKEPVLRAQPTIS